MTAKHLKDLPAGAMLATARMKAAATMPYFRAGVQSLVPREMPADWPHPMAVTRGCHLLFNPALMGDWTPEEAGSVVLHEWLHIYLRHAERFDAVVRAGTIPATPESRKLWNYCADAEINDNLVEARCSLPGDPVVPSTLGCPDHLVAEQYLQELLKQQQDGGGGGKGKEKGDWGPCGSGAGNPVDGEPDQQDPDARTPVEQDLERKSASQQIQAQRSKGQGTVPSGLARFAEAQLQPPRVPWQQRLAVQARAAVAHRAGAGDYTWTRPARQQASLVASFGEDAPVLPGEHQEVVEVAIAIDTRGSMGQRQLEAAIQEAAGILRSLQGSRVTFLACDAKVHTLRRVSGVAQMLQGLQGGGGTDFRPVFEALRRVKPSPDVLVFATDGYGTWPDQPPAGTKVIWLIIEGQNSCPWGTVIQLDEVA